MRLLLLAVFVMGVSAQVDNKRCGLPPNHASLPEFAREELQAIWKDYVPGAPCKKELELTDEILKVLDEFGTDFETDSATFSGNDSSGSSSSTDLETTTTEEPSTTTTSPTTTTASAGVRQRFVPPATLTARRRFKTTTEASSIESSSTPNYRKIASSTVKAADDYYDYHDPAPTQGKVAKSLRKIGSPAFKDYGDVELLRDRKRKTLDENSANFFRTTTRKPEFHSRKASASSTSHQFHDYDFKTNDYADDFNVHFDTPNAPFLKDVPQKVRAEFERLWTNDDIPSEGLRAEKVHLLAVSLLNAEQLEAYNNWATNRKKALKAREEEMAHLTPKARAALRRIARDDEQEQMRLAPAIKRELIGFARRLETRRLRRSRARRS